MRVILKEEYIKVPEDGKSNETANLLSVTITAKARKVTVKGPRGEVKKDFSHLQLDI